MGIRSSCADQSRQPETNIHSENMSLTTRGFRGIRSPPIHRSYVMSCWPIKVSESGHLEAATKMPAPARELANFTILPIHGSDLILCQPIKAARTDTHTERIHRMTSLPHMPTKARLSIRTSEVIPFWPIKTDTCRERRSQRGSLRGITSLRICGQYGNHQHSKAIPNNGLLAQ